MHDAVAIQEIDASESVAAKDLSERRPTESRPASCYPSGAEKRLIVRREESPRNIGPKTAATVGSTSGGIDVVAPAHIVQIRARQMERRKRI
jgi:hypothetical protein